MHQEFSGYYGSTRRKLLFGWVDRQKRAVLERYLGQHRDLKILDLGCGAANVTSIFVGRHHVHGVDQDRQLLRYAAQRGLTTAVGQLDKIPYPDDMFDAVMMIDTIEHVPSRQRCMDEVKRVLKPDGALIAITPRYDSPLWNLGERIALWITARSGSGHISPYITESLDYWMGVHFCAHEIGRLNFGMWLWAFGKARKPSPSAGAG